MATNYWDIGLNSFNDGDPSVIGIQKIWDAMSPPGSLTLLATIVGALWADTYWANTKMDADALATDITAATGIQIADTKKAATAAFRSWHGLLVRGNFSDNAAIPKWDPVTASPDVVVNGKAPLTVKQLVSQWNVYLYTPQPGLKNNTYGRAQSIGLPVPIKQPVLRMYHSDAGFNPPPTSWIKLFTFDGSSETSPLETVSSTPNTINSGERAANSSSFAFTPPGTGHYCIIACAGTEFFSNNPSNQLDNWTSQEWVHYNGAAGWHNIDVIIKKEAVLKFYNQDGLQEHFSFEAHCSKVPKGTVISLECGDERLPNAIQASTTISKSYQVVTAEGVVPPHFTGDLKVRFKTPDDKPLPPGASVDIREYWHLPVGHRHYLQAIDQLGDTRALALQQPVQIPLGNFTFIGPEA